MAKSDQGFMGFMTKNGEKLLVAAAALILAFSAWHWVASSSTTVTLGGQDYTPAQAADAVVNLANTCVKTSLEPASAPSPLPDYKQQLADKMSMKGAAPINLTQSSYGKYEPVPSDQLVPTGAPPEKGSLAEFATVAPVPTKPLVILQRELVDKKPPEDVTAAHVRFEYPLEQLGQTWRTLAIKSGFSPKVIILAVDVEVEETAIDGSVTIRAAQPARLQAENQAQQSPAIPAFDGSNVEAINTALQSYSTSGSWELYLCQPNYWSILDSDLKWYSWGTMIWPKWETLAGRPPTPPAAGPAGGAAGAPARRTPAPAAGGMAGYGLMRPNGEGGEGMPPEMMQSMPMPVAAGQSGVPLPPTYADQLKLSQGSLYVWVHETGLEGNKRYRYRARLQLVNPLLGRRIDVKDEKDAFTASVRTGWSQWSDIEDVPRETEMFLTGSFREQNSVTFTVYSRSQGRTVRESFSLKPGDMLGGKKTVQVPDLADPNKPNQKEVDFSTGLRLVSIDWSRPIARVGLGATRTVAVVLANERGELITRLKSLDDSSPLLKELEDRYRKGSPPPPRATPTPTPRPRAPRPVGPPPPGMGPTEMPPEMLRRGG